jgi:hypothetical protein
MGEKAPTGTRVPLPPEARPPWTVYLNGTEQHEGRDYVVRDGALHFNRPLRRGRRLGAVQRFLFSVGVNFYAEGDAVDVAFSNGSGGRGYAAELPVEAG